MLIKSWLPGFLTRHMARHRRDDWPDPDSARAGRLARLFLDAFLAVKAREGEADAASLAIRGDALEFLEDHPTALAAAILAARQQPVVVATDRTAAEAASIDCPHCGGSGQAMIYHPDYTGEPRIDVVLDSGEVRNIHAKLVAHCVCPLGRWMRAHVSDEIRRRVPDLEAVFNGESRWDTVDPSLPRDPEP